MQNALKSTSFRKAVRIESENGIPLAKTYKDFGGAFGGKLLLLYEPPYASDNVLGLGVFGRVNGTTVSFAGGLESVSPGEPFVPTDELISAVKESVRQMAQDINESDINTMSVVMEEILNYCVVNVPVKQIYDTIRLEYPKEYRVWSLNYKRRYIKTIEEDMDALVSKQHKSHRYGSFKTKMTRLALRQNDVVIVDRYELEQLRTNQIDVYNKIQKQLSEIRPIKDKYIIYKDPVKDQVQLVGKSKESDKFVRTDGFIPVSILKEFDVDADEEEDQLSWMSPEDKKFFGVGDSQGQGQNNVQPQNKQNTQQPSQNQALSVNKIKLESFGIPSDVYKDLNLAIKYKDSIMKVRDWYNNHDYTINDDDFIDLVSRVLGRPTQQPSPSSR